MSPERDRRGEGKRIGAFDRVRDIQSAKGARTRPHQTNPLRAYPGMLLNVDLRNAGGSCENAGCRVLNRPRIPASSHAGIALPS